MDHRPANSDESLDRAEHRLNGAQAPDDAEPSLSLDEQTLADNDQTLSERDQTQSDRDQQASEDDQHAAEFDRDHGGDPEAYQRTAAARAETTHERTATSSLRDRTAQERDLAAQQRDELALARDQAAEHADEEAAHVESNEELAERHALNMKTLRATARAARLRAAQARERAARDRAQAARDRQQAAEDREQAIREREKASTDELTGARRRGVGLEELEHEMQRARREGRALVAAYVDVDGLKAVNDEQGHGAGDELLASVADGLRHHMRPYDLLVRVGGDEFLCVLPVPTDEARRRFEDLRVDLEGSGRRQTVSVGFSELRDGDSPDELVRRADEDLLAHGAS
jgi:diguanylate cyclase (GGDEF)-like protein